VEDVLRPIFGLTRRVEIAKREGEGHAEINVVEVYWLREAAAALSYDTRGNRDQALANGSPLDHKPKDRPGSSSDKTNLFPALRLFQVVSGLVVQDHRTGTGHSVRVGRSESAGLFGVVL
jgi:hypothetical protein